MSLLVAVMSLALSGLVLADLTPTAPGPGDTFDTGDKCTIEWTVDQSGMWKNVSIDLMSGSNDDMTLVTNVVSGLDGTDASLSPYSWTCPDVDPNSAVYFYQFTNNDDKSNSKWTARFTVASASGESDQPEHSQQPNDDSIPWGSGRLASQGGKQPLENAQINDPNPTGETDSYTTRSSDDEDASTASGRPHASGRDRDDPTSTKSIDAEFATPEATDTEQSEAGSSDDEDASATSSLPHPTGRERDDPTSTRSHSEQSEAGNSDDEDASPTSGLPHPTGRERNDPTSTGSVDAEDVAPEPTSTGQSEGATRMTTARKTQSTKTSMADASATAASDDDSVDTSRATPSLPTRKAAASTASASCHCPSSVPGASPGSAIFSAGPRVQTPLGSAYLCTLLMFFVLL